MAGGIDLQHFGSVHQLEIDFQLDIADGAIVGTYFKQDGVFENRADRARVEELMSEAKKFRAQLV